MPYKSEHKTCHRREAPSSSSYHHRSPSWRNASAAEKTESETELKKRLAIAKSEVLEIEHYDYWVSNPEDALQQAVHQIQTIIAAERARIDTQLIETINPLLGVDGVD